MFNWLKRVLCDHDTYMHEYVIDAEDNTTRIEVRCKKCDYVQIVEPYNKTGYTPLVPGSTLRTSP